MIQEQRSDSPSERALAKALDDMGIRDKFMARELVYRLHHNGFMVAPMHAQMEAEITRGPNETQPWTEVVQARVEVASCKLGWSHIFDQRQAGDDEFMREHLPRIVARAIVRPIEESVERQIAARLGERLDVYQGGRLVGTMPALPARSTNPLYDVRPQDFKVTQRDGVRVIDADPKLGGGDLESVAGFRPA